MSISSSLNAGVSGLNANATRLAAISDNIANASTAGYKRVTTSFESMVLGSTSGSYSAGGVSANNTRMISERGTLVSTSSATDIAVTGNGFLPVTTLAEVEAGGDTNMVLTTTGSFSTNAEGYLTTSSGLVLMGWPAQSDGTIPTVARDTDESLEPIKFNVNQLSGEPTTEISLGVNLPATSTESTGDGSSFTMSTEYFDNLGKSETVNIEYVPTVPATGASNEWTMIITDSATNAGGTTIGEYTITFDDSQTAGGSLLSVATTTGTAYDSTTGTVVVTTNSGPLEIYVGEIGADDGLTQLSDEFVAATIEKDGAEAASYTGVEIDEGGYVHVLYDNGASSVAYQVPLADMANPNGMTALDSQTYQPSDDSGSFYLWDAGTGPTSTIAGYSLEESKVDVANELTSMIQTQRAYSSNATVIQTVDEMLQETTNLKR